jgi:hypothetical protein
LTLEEIKGRKKRRGEGVFSAPLFHTKILIEKDEKKMSHFFPLKR